ncbi:MAG: hypothetical protein ABR968_09240 [Bacteroidales bacterium]|jgi:hypothetical protein
MNCSGKLNNVWNKIPLSDYEFHMSHELVGQLQLQNHLTKKYLDIIKPKCVLFVGVAGGNGLEHVDKSVTKEVVCVDINENFLIMTNQRYGGLFDKLLLCHLDITQNEPEVCQADMIWGSLIIEYAGIHESIRFFNKNIKLQGHLIITIQSDNGVHSISDTGVEVIKKLGTVFNIVDTHILEENLIQNGFERQCYEENFLKSGKSLKTFHYQKK